MLPLAGRGILPRPERFRTGVQLPSGDGRGTVAPVGTIRQGHSPSVAGQAGKASASPRTDARPDGRAENKKVAGQAGKASASPRTDARPDGRKAKIHIIRGHSSLTLGPPWGRRRCAGAQSRPLEQSGKDTPPPWQGKPAKPAPARERTHAGGGRKTKKPKPALPPTRAVGSRANSPPHGFHDHLRGDFQLIFERRCVGDGNAGRAEALDGRFEIAMATLRHTRGDFRPEA